MTDADRAKDEWLALRCQANQPGAFADLVRHFEHPLFYFASKIVDSEDVALDVLQEVWFRTSKTIGTLREPRSVRAWLYRLTHGIAVDYVRRDRRRIDAEAEHLSDGEAFALQFDAVRAVDIHRALDRLEPDHREALTLFFLEDFSIPEIASIVGRPEGTVKSRLYYAKQALKQALSEGVSYA